MEIEHVNANILFDVILPAERMKSLLQSRNANKAAFCTTTQFIPQMDAMLRQLDDAGIHTVVFKGRHTMSPGQVLGCDAPIIMNDEADSFIYVGDGFFHPNEILLHNDKPVIAYDPFTHKLEILNPDDVDAIKKKKKRGMLLRFLSSKDIGVIVSVKPGQNFYRASLKLEERYPDKRFHYLIFNTIEFGQLENFSFVECFVNTACSRIGVDDIDKFSKPIVNLEDVLDDFK
jgi:2-(3-amino-3-carboxypropyl)histidine synthase